MKKLMIIMMVIFCMSFAYATNVHVSGKVVGFEDPASRTTSSIDGNNTVDGNTDTVKNYSGVGMSSTDFTLPVMDSAVDNSRSTNLSEEPDLSNVTNFTLATDYATISFGNLSRVNTTGQDYSSNIVFGDCFVAVDSKNLDSSFNATAYLLMNNSDGHCGDNTIFTSDEFAADAGAVKASANICEDCMRISVDGDIVRYRVPHFSSYAIGSNSNMTVDANDPKAVNETVTFTAVYRNSTDGSFISGATCGIGLPNGSVAGMTEGTEEYTYQDSFETGGDYTYNVTCSATGYNTLQTDDEFQIVESVEQIPEFNSIAVLALLVAIVGVVVYKRKN